MFCAVPTSASYFPTMTCNYLHRKLSAFNLRVQRVGGGSGVCRTVGPLVDVIVVDISLCVIVELAVITAARNISVSCLSQNYAIKLNVFIFNGFSLSLVAENLPKKSLNELWL